jgi:septal ring factor EnvC (AmiA/AmiB activator)
LKKYVLIILLALFLGATYEEVLNDKNKQVDIIKKEIEESRNQIRTKRSGISDIERDIDSITTEISIRNDFLKNYENENFLKPGEIANETNKIQALESDVNKIQDNFKNNIVSLYKHGKNYELELLLSAKSPNEYLRRNEYLQKFAQSRKKELRDLKSKKFFLAEKKKLIELSTSSQRFYIEAKRNERNALETVLNTMKDSLANSQKEIDNAEEKINFKNSQLQMVQDFISNFIANKKDFKTNKYSRISYDPDDLGKVKGSLNLPVDLGIIRNEFGEYYFNSSGARLTNNGIDFNISKGSRVFSVSDGIVSLIGDVPYYGKVIIITHNNDYRTVYASVSEVDVALGDKVRLNQIIAKSGETFDGQGIHFEIWQGKIALNPREWIRFQ